jgi:hypothetical protein
LIYISQHPCSALSRGKLLRDPEEHMRTYRRIASAGAALALTLAGGLAMPNSASATTLTGSLYCAQNGSSTFGCTLTISGGTSPYTTTWATGGSYSSLTSTSTYSAQGNCGSKVFAFWVTASVRDAAGTTWNSGQYRMQCEYGWPNG